MIEHEKTEGQLAFFVNHLRIAAGKSSGCSQDVRIELCRATLRTGCQSSVFERVAVLVERRDAAIALLNRFEYDLRILQGRPDGRGPVAGRSFAASSSPSLAGLAAASPVSYAA
jgi:hypothetical protein